MIFEPQTLSSVCIVTQKRPKWSNTAKYNTELNWQCGHVGKDNAHQHDDTLVVQTPCNLQLNHNKRGHNYATPLGISLSHSKHSPKNTSDSSQVLTSYD